MNAGTTDASDDDALGSELVEFGDIVHFWSPDGSILFGVTAGSAVVAASLNPAVLTGIAHTAITNIDLQPTGNPDEFTVAIEWTDGDGNPQTTTDPTPITIAGGASSDYATADLTSDGDRTHTWGHSQTENFDGGTHSRNYEISQVFGAGTHEITENS